MSKEKILEKYQPILVVHLGSHATPEDLARITPRIAEQFKEYKCLFLTNNVPQTKVELLSVFKEQVADVDELRKKVDETINSLTLKKV